MAAKPTNVQEFEYNEISKMVNEIFKILKNDLNDAIDESSLRSLASKITEYVIAQFRPSPEKLAKNLLSFWEHTSVLATQEFNVEQEHYEKLLKILPETSEKYAEAKAFLQLKEKHCANRIKRAKLQFAFWVATNFSSPEVLKAILKLFEMINNEAEAAKIDESTLNNSVINTLRKILAEYTHGFWKDCIKFVLDNTIEADDGSEEIPPLMANLWKEKIKLPYDNISPTDKEYFLKKADNIIKIMQGWFKEER
jgi:hypothetical protein